ncbi:MAG TPA: VOC family protein [Actinotalea sp.]|nr:VOC family protein [Actinotalea sp.]
MLADYTPIPTLAVRDLPRAREFYEGVLGFTPQGDAPDGELYAAGAATFMVYPSAYAGTNKATAMSFDLPGDAFDAEVAALREKGLVFQTFEMEDLVWDDGVASWGATRSVWFEDPDGNILNVETHAEG